MEWTNYNFSDLSQRVGFAVLILNFEFGSKKTGGGEEVGDSLKIMNMEGQSNPKGPR